jgi:hypothetical protein
MVGNGNRFLQRLLAVAVVAMSGCGNVVNQPKGPSQGAIADSWTLTGKCQAVVNWIAKLQDEYPNTAPLHFTPDHPGVANLLRSKYFVPVYGVTYSFKNAPTLKTISHDVLYQCYGLGTFRTFANQLQHYKVLFDNIFVIRLQGQGRGKNLPQAVENLEVLQTAMEEDIKMVSELPVKDKSFAQMEERLSEGTTKFKVLWPSEHKAYVSTMTESKNNMARALSAAISREADSMEPSLANARRIRNTLLPNAARYQRVVATASDADIESKLQLRVEAIVAKLVQDRVVSLNSVPVDDSGLKPSEQWYRQFEEDFAGFTELAPVANAVTALSKRRDTMYRAAKPAFMFALNAIPPSRENVSKGDALLQQTFTLPSDLNLPVYEEYKKAVTTKSEEMLGALASKKLEELRAFPSTFQSATQILQWKKDLDSQYGSLKGHAHVQAIFDEYDKRRQQVLQGAKREFAQRQMALPRSQDGIRMSTEMLDSLFPVLEDEQLPMYGEYKRIVLKRIASIRGEPGSNDDKGPVQAPSDRKSAQGENGDDCSSGLGKFFTDVFRPFYQETYAKQHEILELSEEERDKLAAAIDRIEGQIIRKYDSVQLYGQKMSDTDKEALKQLIDKYSAESLMAPEDVEIKALQELQTMKETRLPPSPASMYSWGLKFRKSALTDKRTKEEWPSLIRKLPKYPTVRQDVLEYFDNKCRLLK